MPETQPETQISEAVFRNLLQQRLGDLWEKALVLFRSCGPHLSWDLTNILLCAVGKGRAAQVLEIIKEHFEERLCYQAPEKRGKLASVFGANPTKVLFARIYKDVLGFESAPTA